ncbi:MAG: hypothetical protein IKE22_13070 [Atopobiaceae bacterium]|nr:hypothetical protein [Atopobiaceae bacterium]
MSRWIDTLPAHIEATTGVPAETVRASEDRLLEALEVYLLQYLHCPDGTDSDRLRIVVDSLEKTVAARHVAEKEKAE